ncbi:cytochrome P450 [Marasmius fiardii PR-910]|nr:cytochrome P450 [Marasmius fiardii PR-910]
MALSIISSTFQTALPYVVILLSLGILLHRCWYSIHTQHPPGPTPLPFIGNLLQIPTINPEHTFTNWSAVYGDVVYLQIFQQPMVLLNTFEAAQDLLEKRSAIYSDRPRFVLFSELMGWQNASTHVRYGPRFRKHRRFIHQTFNQQASQILKPIQEKETLTLIRGLMTTPDHFYQHLRRFAAATILKVTYGADVTSVDDLYIQLAERAGTLTVQSGTPAATLVDFFPFMRHIPTWAPLAGFKRNAAVVKEAVDRMMNVPYEMVKREMKSGRITPCLTSKLLEQYSHSPAMTLSFEDEEDIKGVAGTMFAAAEDTTISVLTTFVLVMVLHPRVFQKAQEEMDRVIGKDSLPSTEDRDSLPYFECVMKEVLRWNPPAPLGLPHRVIQDDVYRGYHIPEGSTVIVNIYSILKSCPQPDRFYPERYLEETDLIDPFEVVFGFGRRRCPGRHFADTGLWLALATVVATMEISKTIDAQGREITPEVAFKSGFIRHPESFTCSMKPRSGSLERIIESSHSQATN